MEIWNDAPRNLFFTGKGGVGKTSLACATAIALADAGKSVLLVSTDPASNLEEVLGVTLDATPRPIPDVSGLFAINIDPEAAARSYRERLVGPYRGVLPETVLRSMEEQLSGACTVEIAAFDEFAKLLSESSPTSSYDHVVFDTAPTGHTLRLLSLPSAWSTFLDHSTTGTSCLGPLAGLQSQRNTYRRAVETLCDRKFTSVVIVARAEDSALREAGRTSDELLALGIANQSLLINGVFRASDRRDPIAVAMQDRGEEALARLPATLQSWPRTVIPWRSEGMMGVAALRTVSTSTVLPLTPPMDVDDEYVSPTTTLHSLIEELAHTQRGILMTMGKGGVGKTPMAAAIAVALAERGCDVTLSTSDPAAHLAETLVGSLPNLRVQRIDPQAEVRAYAAEVMATTGAQLDEAGQALLAEDLRSPCTEEMAVFRAFAAIVDEAQQHLVVLDTAPTGHTILLLDAALAYHREVTRKASTVLTSVEQLLPRLRDPDFTRVVLVALPEPTPVHEAAQLQRDLRRAGIEPYAWIINQCLMPLRVTDPLLKSRRHRERRMLQEVTTQLASRVAMIPWQSVVPVGIDRLRQLSEPIDAHIASAQEDAFTTEK